MNNTFEMFIKEDLPAHTIILWWVKLEELWAGHKIEVFFFLFSAIVKDCCRDNEGHKNQVEYVCELGKMFDNKI